jgi:uncharacterized protein (TIGR00255 family)
MRSMTGYGTAATAVPGGRVTVEVHSLNQRFLDVRIVAPREYAPWEGELRDLVRAAAARGRIELLVNRTVGANGQRFRVEVRSDLARAYVAALRRLKREMRLAGEVDVALLRGMPELVRTVEQAADPAREMPAVRRAVRRALAALDRERRREGGHLGRDMSARVGALARIARTLEGRLPAAVRDLQRRAAERVTRLAAGVPVDAQRLAQEAAILAERGDVTEELVRLGSHLEALRGLLRAREPTGKRIEFLLQEVHREVNTIGSKMLDPRVSGLVLDAKAEVEKLREQVQNVE